MNLTALNCNRRSMTNHDGFTEGESGIQYLLMKSCLILAVFIALSITACSKTENLVIKDSILTSFESLTAEKDTLKRGQSTEITARAEGYKIMFKWYATEGELLGSGSQITFVASPCCTGNSIITCEAIAANTSESKSITIIVIQ